MERILKNKLSPLRVKDSTKETRPVIKLQPTITHRATTSNKLALHKCKLNTTKTDSSSTHHCKYYDKICQHRQSLNKHM